MKFSSKKSISKCEALFSSLSCIHSIYQCRFLDFLHNISPQHLRLLRKQKKGEIKSTKKIFLLPITKNSLHFRTAFFFKFCIKGFWENVLSRYDLNFWQQDWLNWCLLCDFYDKEFLVNSRFFFAVDFLMAKFLPFFF